MAYRFRRLFLAALGMLGWMSAAFGSSFEANLPRIHTLRSQKNQAALIGLLDSTRAAADLEDVRLFLLGEALKAAGNNERAIQVFARLRKTHPQSIGARKAGFPYVMAHKPPAGQESREELLKIARELPTAYQRGKALENLLAWFTDPGQAGKIALESLRAYHSDTSFYQTVAESKGLLELLLNRPGAFHLARNEWLEVLLWANREGLESVVLATIGGFSGIFGPDFGGISRLVQGDAQCKSKNKVRGLETLNAILAQPGLARDLRAFGHQLRGDAYHFLDKHDAAVHDYREALAWGKAPVDVVACRYRLMRSLFQLNRDEECVAELKHLAPFTKAIGVMPVHVYDMGLQRFDAGRKNEAVPFFRYLASQFAGHYRADDALGYCILANGPGSAEGKRDLARLEEKYPHSFFLYWVSPSSRNKPLPRKQTVHPIAPFFQNRLSSWKKLLNSPLEEIAITDIKDMLNENPEQWGVFRAAMEAYREAGNYHQLTGAAERLLRETLDRGKSGRDLPDWAWKGYFPKPYWSQITQQARTYRLDPYWVLSIMREESHFNPKTLSRSNAMGLMQILPTTGKWIQGKLGIKGKYHQDSLWDISRNIAFGSWYLNYLRELFAGDLFLAAAAYNGGQGNILRKVEQGPHAKLPVLERLDRVPLPETRDYFKKVMGSWWCYQRLYKE